MSKDINFKGSGAFIVSVWEMKQSALRFLRPWKAAAAAAEKVFPDQIELTRHRGWKFPSKSIADSKTLIQLMSLSLFAFFPFLPPSLHTNSSFFVLLTIDSESGSRGNWKFITEHKKIKWKFPRISQWRHTAKISALDREHDKNVMELLTSFYSVCVRSSLLYCHSIVRWL